MTELENPFVAPRSRPSRTWIAVVAVVVAAGALAADFALYRSLDSANRTASSLQVEVTDLESQLASVQATLADTTTRLQATGSSAASTVDIGQVVAQDLPRYPDSGEDMAIGLSLGQVSGVWYADGTVHTIDPADGTARAWLVWAHWCPHCQAELPIVKAWYEENAAANPDMDIVSIATAIDDSGPNPLLPYLADEEFPFPVIIDDSGGLSARFGVNAFPFWVFTAPDGTVLGRTVGELPEDQLTAIFEQLEAIGSTS
jgi:cytochrome c biogenesis protein CcmG/thiol:disulfide interchange protein DsbE